MGCNKRCHDCLDDRFSFLKNLIIPKPQNSKARRCKELGSLLIFSNCIRMLPAIQFNDQLLLQTDEIEHEIVERVLAAKFDTELLAAQMLPKQAFGIGGVVAEFLRNPVLSQPVVVLSVHLFTHPHPSPPLEGEGT